MSIMIHVLYVYSCTIHRVPSLSLYPILTREREVERKREREGGREGWRERERDKRL
jgi:hypothetical protein